MNRTTDPKLLEQVKKSSALAIEEMSAVGTGLKGQTSSVETRQMSAVGTRQM